MNLIIAHWPELALTGVLIACAAVFVWACNMDCKGGGGG